MMYFNATKTVYKKENNKWVKTYETDNLEIIYTSLANELIAKKINQCTYIKSIKRIPMYDGTQKIVIYQNNDIKTIYHIHN